MTRGRKEKRIRRQAIGEEKEGRENRRENRRSERERREEKQRNYLLCKVFECFFAHQPTKISITALQIRNRI